VAFGPASQVAPDALSAPGCAASERASGPGEALPASTYSHRRLAKRPSPAAHRLVRPRPQNPVEAVNRSGPRGYKAVSPCSQALLLPDGRPSPTPVHVRATLIRRPEDLAQAPPLESDEGALQSFGMVEVELSSEGRPVHLGAPVELSFPLAAGHGRVDGDAIGLYHYDEAGGRWTRAGEGRVQGERFVATVSHFSWWNADEPLSRTGCVAGRVSAGGEGRVELVGVEALVRSQGSLDEGAFCLDSLADTEVFLRAAPKAGTCWVEAEVFSRSRTSAAATCAIAPASCTQVVLEAVPCPSEEPARETGARLSSPPQTPSDAGSRGVMRGGQQGGMQGGVEQSLALARKAALLRDATVVPSGENVEGTRVLLTELVGARPFVRAEALLPAAPTARSAANGGLSPDERAKVLAVRARSEPDIPPHVLDRILLLDEGSTAGGSDWITRASALADASPDGDVDLLALLALRLADADRSLEAADRAGQALRLVNGELTPVRATRLHELVARGAELRWRRADPSDGAARTEVRAAAVAWQMAARRAGLDPAPARALCEAATVAEEPCPP
jgi:hypothetical protein